MPVRFDFDFTDDLVFSADGDLSLVESDNEHVKDTVSAYPGEWKENHDDGVGIRDYLGASDFQEAAKKMRIQLESDGYVVNNPTVSKNDAGGYEINPNATI